MRRRTSSPPGIQSLALTNPDPTRVAHLAWWREILVSAKSVKQLESMSFFLDFNACRLATYKLKSTSVGVGLDCSHPRHGAVSSNLLGMSLLQSLIQSMPTTL